MDATSIVARINQGEKGIKLLIIEINHSKTRISEHIQYLWAYNLSRCQFLNALLKVSKLSHLNSFTFQQPYYVGSPVQIEDTKIIPFSGLYENVIRRSGHYLSDFVDGIRGEGTCSKVISTTLFLYFLTILASTAMGVLNEKNTRGKIST